MDAGQVAEAEPTADVDLPKATPRTEKAEKSNDAEAGDGRPGRAVSVSVTTEAVRAGRNRNRNRRRREEEQIPEGELEVREGPARHLSRRVTASFE